jgi:ABC-2 type transport system ATP-binding protein
VIIIDRGRIAAEGSPQDLRESWVGNTLVRVELKDEAADAANILAGIDGVVKVQKIGDGGGHLELECSGKSDPREDVFKTVVANGWTLLELSEERASLEDIFVRLTTRDVAEKAESDLGRAETGEEVEP